MSPKTFPVLIEQGDGTNGAGEYRSPTGKPPEVGDVIPLDQHGGEGTVTAVFPDDPVPIHAKVRAPVVEDRIRGGAASRPGEWDNRKVVTGAALAARQLTQKRR